MPSRRALHNSINTSGSFIIAIRPVGQPLSVRRFANTVIPTSKTSVARDQSVRIHPMAIVSTDAQLSECVTVGPYCIVGPHVKLDAGAHLLSHVSVTGHTSIGEHTRVFPFASLGHEPQDLKFRGEISSLSIGAHCTIRECVTVHCGTEGGGGSTIIGDRCLVMANSHVAHDCRIGNGVVLSNNVLLAGHVTVGDNATFGGGSAVHQFVRVGRGSFVGGLAGVARDVVPFGMALGCPAQVEGVNVKGMKRQGYSRQDIQAVVQFYRAVIGRPPGQSLNATFDILSHSVRGEDFGRDILDFVKDNSRRGFCL